ncbi:NAD(H) kinase 1 [Hibiscus syriacus]|uniref:NAD(H) kinase 1 n=1 Tax=Hibiscus syriacus TaxID=106335 RepID=A0A6A3CYV2_HIBSY|nr:NAD(H) kinase 1 [Hibiscus syriacus]
MTPYKDDSTASFGHGDASVSCLKPENGFIDPLSLFHSEKAVEELLQQTPVQGMDEHLILFSKALRTVAKALRHAAEGKASAQAEAAEWKRRYELERSRNIQMECKARIAEQSGNIDCGRVKNLDKQLMQQNDLDEQFEECCMKHGICSHEVLRDRESDSNSNVDRSKMMRKGENGDQHKHDIVSFEKGNITTAERSSKQISLKWESDPQTVLILTKPNSVSVRILCAQMVSCDFALSDSRLPQQLVSEID